MAWYCGIAAEGAVLYGKVDAILLQHALDDLLPRFPSFNVLMRQGVFWYYFEKNIKRPPTVYEENDYPCRHMEAAANRGFLFRVTYFEDRLQEGDVVFLAGNAGNGMDHSAYTTIAKLCDEKGVKLVLDTTKDLLTKCLPYHPFIIKPNHHELGEIFGVTIETEEQIVNYAKQLQQMGARNVLISRGGDGAMLITETGEVYTSNVPKGTLVNSVGAGDSMLSGFMAKFIETGDYAASLRQGAATGSATAFSVGIAEKAFIEELLPQIVVTKL